MIVDVTDVEKPVPLGWPGGVPFPSKGAHTIVSHPTRPVLYVASQELPDRTPTIEIVDLSSWPPTLKVASMPPTGVGPHDITFNPTGTRAYVSSINATFIIDTTDPLNPVTTPPIAAIVDPEIRIHHEATLHPDGRHLLVVDEFVAAPPVGTPSCPGGGVVVFDLGPGNALERTPVKVGSFYADDHSVPATEDTHGTILDPACTAHEFKVSAKGTWMPISWMGGGTRVFDLTDLVEAATQPAPVPVIAPEIGFFKQTENDVWAAKPHPDARFHDYVIVSDTAATPASGRCRSR
jgi:hypothetical protein